MAYTFRYGGDWGGGFCMCVGNDTVNDPNWLVAAGDTWGLRVSPNAGDRWYGVQGQDLSSNKQYNAYGRMLAISQKHEHTAYLVTGTFGSGTHGHTIKISGTNPAAIMSVLDTTGGGGNTGSGAKGGEPRSSGPGAVIWDGNPSHIEYLFLGNNDGIVRWADEGSKTILQSASASGAGNTTFISTFGWKFITALDSTTVLAATSRNTTAADPFSGQILWLITAATGGSPVITNITGLHGAPQCISTIRKVGSNFYCACYSDGVYQMTWNGTTASFTQVWAGDGGQTVSDVAGTTGACMIASSDNRSSVVQGHQLAFTGNDFATAPTYNAQNVDFTVAGTTTTWWNSPGKNQTTKNYLGVSNGDQQMICSVDANTFISVGRAGGYKTTNQGTTWHPAVQGLNGNMGTTIGTDGNGMVVANSTDFTWMQSTDHGATVNGTFGSQPSGTTQQTGLSVTAGGHTYTVGYNSAASPNYWDVKQDGVSIIDAEGKGALQAPRAIAADASGYLYIVQGGGWVVGTPGQTVDNTPPTPPTSVTATPQGSSTVNLSWSGATDNIAVTQYHVKRNGATISAPTSPTYTDSGLQPATQYTYTVTALDAHGNESVASNPAVATTGAASGDTTPPTVPTIVNLVATSPTTATLTWGASTDDVGVAGYTIYRNQANIGSTTASPFTDTNLSPLTSYSYFLRAFDAAGNVSGASSMRTVTTPSSNTPVLIGSSSTNAFTDTLAEPSTSYIYQVTAVDAVPNESGPSNQVSVTTPPITTSGDPVIGSTSGTGTTTASATPFVGTTLNDMMLAQVTVVGAAAITTVPSGWQLISSQHDASRILQAVYTVGAGASETNAYTWAASGATSIDVNLTTLRNVTLSNANPAANTTSGTSSNQPVIPSLTGIKQGDLVLAFVASDSSPVFHARQGCTLGCMPDGSLSNWADNTAMATFETLIGRKTHFSHSMIPWDVGSGGSVKWPNRALGAGNANIIGDYNANRLSYVSWPRPRTTTGGESTWNSVVGTTADPNAVFDSFVAGTYDSALTNLGNAFKAWEHLVVCRLFWESNDGMPWSIASSSAPAQYAAKYIAACRHIISHVNAITPNVWWHFNPQLSENNPVSPGSAHYWGDAYATYVGNEWYMNAAVGTQTANKADTFVNHEQAIYNLYLSHKNAQGQPMVYGAGEGAAHKPSGTVAGSQAFSYNSCNTAIVPQGSNPSAHGQWKFLTQWDNAGGFNNQLSVAQADGLTAYKNWVSTPYMEVALTDTWLPVPLWEEEYQSRHPLGSIRTNYGAGMQGHALYSFTSTGTTSPTATLQSGGLARHSVIVLAVTPGGGGGGDTQGPQVTVTPAGNVTLPAGTTSQVISGQAVDPSGVASVILNGVSLTLDSSGHFSQTMSLSTGANPVTLVATDSSANQNKTTISYTITVSSAGGSGTKVAFTADFGVSTISSNVINQIPTDSSLAYVIDGGDNYPRGANDAASPTALTTEIGYYRNRGLMSRLIGVPGNHEGCNRDIVPTTANPTFQGFIYCWTNPNGLAAGNAGNAASGIVVKTVGAWTIIGLNTVLPSTNRALDGLVNDTDCGIGPAQLSALVAALPSGNRRCIVFGHHPVWNADASDHTDGTNGTPNQLANMRGVGSGPGNANVWGALQGHATAYVSGHAHNMQLHQPRDATGVVAAKGVTQIIAGSAGGLNYTLNNTYFPAPLFVDGNGVPGYCLLDLSSSASLGVSFIGQTGSVLHTAQIDAT